MLTVVVESCVVVATLSVSPVPVAKLLVLQVVCGLEEVVTGTVMVEG